MNNNEPDSAAPTLSNIVPALNRIIPNPFNEILIFGVDSIANSGTAEYHVAALRFHISRGKLINLTDSGRTASRDIGLHSNGIVFSDRPVIPMEHIVFSITNNLDSRWSGSLRIGLSTIDPAIFLNNRTLHDGTREEFEAIHGITMKHVNASLCKDKNIFHCVLNDQQELIYGVNFDQYTHVIKPTEASTGNIWLILDLYGITVRATFLHNDDPILDQYRIRYPSGEASSSVNRSSSSQSISQQTRKPKRNQEGNALTTQPIQTNRPTQIQLDNSIRIQPNSVTQIQTDHPSQVQVDFEPFCYNPTQHYYPSLGESRNSGQKQAGNSSQKQAGSSSQKQASNSSQNQPVYASQSQPSLADHVIQGSYGQHRYSSDIQPRYNSQVQTNYPSIMPPSYTSQIQPTYPSHIIEVFSPQNQPDHSTENQSGSSSNNFRQGYMSVVPAANTPAYGENLSGDLNFLTRHNTRCDNQTARRPISAVRLNNTGQINYDSHYVPTTPPFFTNETSNFSTTNHSHDNSTVIAPVLEIPRLAVPDPMFYPSLIESVNVDHRIVSDISTIPSLQTIYDNTSQTVRASAEERATYTRSPKRFHTNHGSGVELDSERIQARYTIGAQRPYVFVQNQMNPSTLISIKINRVVARSFNSLYFGVTAANPDDIEVENLPGNPLALQSASDYYQPFRMLEPVLKVNDIVTFFYNHSGSFEFEVNGKRTLCGSVIADMPLWFFACVKDPVQEFSLIGTEIPLPTSNSQLIDGPVSNFHRCNNFENPQSHITYVTSHFPSQAEDLLSLQRNTHVIQNPRNTIISSSPQEQVAPANNYASSAPQPAIVNHSLNSVTGEMHFGSGLSYDAITENPISFNNIDENTLNHGNLSTTPNQINLNTVSPNDDLQNIPGEAEGTYINTVEDNHTSTSNTSRENLGVDSRDVRSLLDSEIIRSGNQTDGVVYHIPDANNSVNSGVSDVHNILEQTHIQVRNRTHPNNLPILHGTIPSYPTSGIRSGSREMIRSLNHSLTPEQILQTEAHLEVSNTSTRNMPTTTTNHIRNPMAPDPTPAARNNSYVTRYSESTAIRNRARNLVGSNHYRINHSLFPNTEELLREIPMVDEANLRSLNTRSFRSNGIIIPDAIRGRTLIESNINAGSKTCTKRKFNRELSHEKASSDADYLPSTSALPKKSSSSSSIPKHSLIDDYDPENCSICIDAEPATVCYPCGHLIMCISCAKEYFRIYPPGSRICPLCREEVSDIIKVFKQVYIS
uniref:NHR domain-containing protein n=1 Tax=Rhabditophanes sp. KR3021 TaxID=114890 RepID=A0AC35U7W4_9BILA